MRHSRNIRLFGVLSVALLFLGACTQKMETPATTSAPPAQQSSPPVVEEKSVQLGQAGTSRASEVSPSPPAPRTELARRFRDTMASKSGAASMSHYPYAPPPYYPYPRVIPPGVDRFPDKEPNSVLSAAEHPVSIFSVDVDTASYAFVRRSLTGGQLPPREAVRVEEMVNYFPYAYPSPQDRSQPFRVTTTLMPSPWSADNQLLHIAIRGYDIERAQRPRLNVVLLIDTSGSMQPGDRLPLLQQGFRLFAQQLRDDDRVAIVTYAGDAKTAL
jgi:Ca-activated chloride channel family protein